MFHPTPAPIRHELNIVSTSQQIISTLRSSISILLSAFLQLSHHPGNEKIRGALEKRTTDAFDTERLGAAGSSGVNGTNPSLPHLFLHPSDSVSFEGLVKDCAPLHAAKLCQPRWDMSARSSDSESRVKHCCQEILSRLS